MNLNISSSNLRLEIHRITRKNGVMLAKLAYSAPAHSFVQQWVQAMRALWMQGNEANTKDTAGVLRLYNGTAMRITAPAGDTSHGIVLGTGTNAVAITDYALQTKILHGSGAGQLQYKIQDFQAYSLVGSTAKFKAARQYENLSGATITINEAGIYVRDGSGQYFCILRDRIAGGFDILNTQIAEFRYTFKATV
jgi:hypothetical protein